MDDDAPLDFSLKRPPTSSADPPVPGFRLLKDDNANDILSMANDDPKDKMTMVFKKLMADKERKAAEAAMANAAKLNSKTSAPSSVSVASSGPSPAKRPALSNANLPKGEQKPSATTAAATPNLSNVDPALTIMTALQSLAAAGNLGSALTPAMLLGAAGAQSAVAAAAANRTTSSQTATAPSLNRSGLGTSGVVFPKKEAFDTAAASNGTGPVGQSNGTRLTPSSSPSNLSLPNLPTLKHGSASSTPASVKSETAASNNNTTGSSGGGGGGGSGSSSSGGGGGGGSNKTLRPFKAYPKDPLSLPLGYYGLPGMSPFPPIDIVPGINEKEMTSEEMFAAYKTHVLKLHHQQQQQQQHQQEPVEEAAVEVDAMKEEEVTHVEPTEPAASNGVSSQPVLPAGLTSSITGLSAEAQQLLADALGAAANTTTTQTQQANKTSTPRSRPQARKRGRTLPDDQKDESYWERRRKNNEAAKRSRDSRRAKEDEIAIRAAFLEQENLKLRLEVQSLRAEISKLRSLLYANNGEEDPEAEATSPSSETAPDAAVNEASDELVA